MRRLCIFFGFGLLVMNACVPARKLVYLQNEDELAKRKEIPKDSVLRKHTLDVREYRIQPLDLLSISFETLGDENDKFDFLSKISSQARGSSLAAASLSGILVNKEGEVEYAVLGKVKVAGLTPFEAQDTIRAFASRYLDDVVVRVRLLNFRFTVLGEVNGEKTIVSPNTRLTMMEAIGLSGGLGELADRSAVKVIRQNGGETEIYYVDLLKEQFLESPYYYVQQNDVIIVPPLKQRTFRKYFSGNIGILTASISFAVFVITILR